MEFTKFDADGDALIVLDEYEANILHEALETHVALAKLDVDRMTERLKREHPADWRNSPDLAHAEEMLDRATATMEDFDVLLRRLG